jgi:FkbM family methyltransferase
LSSRQVERAASRYSPRAAGTAGLKRASRYLKAVAEARVHRSYTPTGEDVILRYLFDSVGIAHPDYLDIGTGDPVNGNNTYVFYRDGSRGVCVEAHPDLAREIATIRRRDVCLNVAVGVGEGGSVEVYIFDVAGLSTIDAEEAVQREALGTYRVIRTVSVPLQTINQVIATHFTRYPALVSLDIEGMDHAVLRSLDDERFPIPVICVETVAFGESHIRKKEHAIAELLESRGYFLYADTFINSIFVRDAWYRSQASARLY